MSKRTALVTNALDFVGPPAVRALLDDGYDVVAQDPAFRDIDKQEEYKASHPGADPLGIRDPKELIRHVWDNRKKVDVIISNDTFPAIHVPIEQAVTSCRTELPLPGGAIPDIARAGANALVKSLSIELAPFGIPVNAIAPNYLYSEAYFPKAKFMDDPVGRDFIKGVVPAGRLGRPEEIGELVSYLANMKGSFHTGTIIKFAGGWPAAPRRPV